MNDKKTPGRKWKIAAVAGAVIIVFLTGIRLSKLREKSPASDLSRYDYRDTRHLVALTGRAAALINNEGEKAFEVFRKNSAQWSLHGSSYL